MTNSAVGKQDMLNNPDPIWALKQKDWADCTADERIEKLCLEAESLEYAWGRIVALEDKVRMLERHKHVDGDVVFTANEVVSRPSFGQASSLRNKLR